MDSHVKEKLLTSQMLLTLEGIARQLSEIANRQMEILERNEALIEKNTEAFRLAGEKFTMEIIRAEVEKCIRNDKKALQYKNRKYGQGG